MLRWFKKPGERAGEQQAPLVLEGLRQQRVDTANLEQKISILVAELRQQRSVIETLEGGIANVKVEMRDRCSDLQRAMHDDTKGIRREQDATGRQVIRRTDEAAIVGQQQFTHIVKLVDDMRQLYKKETDRILERADEAAQFYDGIVMFMRDVRQAGDIENRIGELLNAFSIWSGESKLKLDEEAECSAQRHDERSKAESDRHEDLRFRLEELKLKLEEGAHRSTIHQDDRRAIDDTRYEDLRSRLEELKLKLEEDSRRTDLTVRTDRWTLEQAQAFRDTLRLLNPYSVSGHEMSRIGREHDGGYVLINDFRDVTAALSLGINDDDSWDFELAERGVRVFQFDHTIEASPTTHERLVFQKRRVTGSGGMDAITLSDIIHECVDAGHKKLIVKMDIEADEWDVIDATQSFQFATISQLVCEFHNLDRINDNKFHKLVRRCFTKLHDDFFVCHVHGNNSGPIAILGNIPLPGTLEVTFANRAFYTPEKTWRTFPTPLDSPNQEGRADLYLGSFCF